MLSYYIKVGERMEEEEEIKKRSEINFSIHFAPKWLIWTFTVKSVMGVREGPD